ncbi:MAG TPA: tetratricopeptide repeat protein, partial [Thermoanaerobaculia bacterium]|nr:tetratricopeptide repeat protein [Thermoanaerobaculia bacterium]
VHRRAARNEAVLTSRLDRALALRDAGDLDAAAGERALAAEGAPGSHVAHVLRGEIHYRQGRLEEAEAAYRGAVAVHPGYAPAWRHLAVLALRREDLAAAAVAARRGLAVAPADPQLAYLKARAEGRSAAGLAARLPALGPAAARTLVALAFEVGDTAGARQLVERSVDLWPAESWFHAARVELGVDRPPAPAPTGRAAREGRAGSGRAAPPRRR